MSLEGGLRFKFEIQLSTTHNFHKTPITQKTMYEVMQNLGGKGFEKYTRIVT